MTTDLTAAFEEHYTEVESYLSFLQNVEFATRDGAPRLKSTDELITPEQKKILNSSLYLQLYGLVEATVLRCLEALAEGIERAQRQPAQLSKAILSEWVRSAARTHKELSAENRLKGVLDVVTSILQGSPVPKFQVETGGGGNWDDHSIDTLFTRIGCILRFSREVQEGVKRPMRADMGALKLVKTRRNELAHGTISFVDCGDGLTVAELQDLTSAVGGYLREAVTCFEKFIQREFA